MYMPKHFEIIDETEIYKSIEMNSFGHLISLHYAEIVTTHMPFLFDEGSGVLFGHLAKANPHWQQMPKQKVLVALLGQHAYINPSWYESSGVPTWNYQAGNIEVVAQSFTDSEKLKHVLDTLTKANESTYKILESPTTQPQC